MEKQIEESRQFALFEKMASQHITIDNQKSRSANKKKGFGERLYNYAKEYENKKKALREQKLSQERETEKRAVSLSKEKWQERQNMRKSYQMKKHA